MTRSFVTTLLVPISFLVGCTISGSGAPPKAPTEQLGADPCPGSDSGSESGSSRLAVRAELDSTRSAKDALRRLQRRIPGLKASPREFDAAEVAGLYSTEASELAEMVGGGFLAGSNLYLFRNGAYVYTEWADIEPETIKEQGRWSMDELVINLLPGDTALLGPRRDHSYIPFQFASGNRMTSHIIGTPCQLRDLEQSAGGDDPRFALLLDSLQLVEHFDAQRSSVVLAEILNRVKRLNTRPDDLRQ